MSTLGFPSELDYHTLKSMFPSRKTEYRKNPISGTKFSTPGQDIQLMINKQENSFMNPDTLTISFDVAYTVAVRVRVILGCRKGLPGLHQKQGITKGMYWPHSCMS